MPLIPLQIPPGVYRNGTDFQSSNRWRDASLVRWTEGTLRPVGGWNFRQTMNTTAPRAALAWQDLGADKWVAAGFHDGLIAMTASGLVYDITPVDLVAGDLDATVNTGYGGEFYGLEDYGTERADSGQFSEATTWSLDNWGENLVACSTEDGRLLEWDLDTAADAAAILNAPTSNSGLLVTEERFLFALGAGGNPRKVQWSDREDNTLWAPDATNEAGDIELQMPGKIMCGIRTRGQALILSDTDAHSATYIGGQFVYGFQRVGSACGIVSRKAAASVDEGVFWMGRSGFHLYAGGAVQELPCEVSDYVFTDLNTGQISKVWAVSNQTFNEVWWFYPSSGSNEIDRYVVFNYAERHWAIGSLSRTAGVDSGAFTFPIWMTTDGAAFDQEFGLSLGGQTAFAETGPISLGAGDAVMKATKLIPDEKTQGQVQAVFKTRFHPNDVERAYGPYAMANPTSVRFTGRQLRMRVEATQLADWRVGVMRLDAVPGGRR
jgi:hypothetical protein